MTIDSPKGPEREARPGPDGVAELAPGIHAVQLREESDWDAIADWIGGAVKNWRDESDEWHSYIGIPQQGGEPSKAWEWDWIVRYPTGETRIVDTDAMPVSALHPQLWDKLAAAMHNGCSACGDDPNVGCRDRHEAEHTVTHALKVIAPELERRTAEVERLRKRVHTAVDETQRRYAPFQSRCHTFDVWSKWARAAYERHGGLWGMESEATRLVVQSLLQERDALSGLLRGMARRVGEYRQAARAEADLLDALQARFNEAVEDWSRNDEQVLAENQRLADQLAAAAALVADFRQRAEQTVATFGENGQHDDECDSPAECHASAQHFTWKLAARALEKALAAGTSAKDGGDHG